MGESQINGFEKALGTTGGEGVEPFPPIGLEAFFSENVRNH